MQRTRLVLNVGNLLELVGAGCGVYGVGRLAGFAWALVLAGVLLVVAAELIYDGHLWRIPLPHKPEPRRWLLERRQRVEKWRTQRTALKAIARQRALDVAAERASPMVGEEGR
jgi:hypothetical protein